VIEKVLKYPSLCYNRSLDCSTGPDRRCYKALQLQLLLDRCQGAMAARAQGQRTATAASPAA